MRAVIDIECNALINPDKIWVVVCKDIDTGEYHIFRRVSDDTTVGERLKAFIEEADQLVGHNILGYDAPHLARLCRVDLRSLYSRCIDTLVLSKLVNYSRKGHSIEDYGLEYGIPKGSFSDWSSYSQEMEDYCVRDVDICERLYHSFDAIVNDPSWIPSIQAEQQFQYKAVNDLSDNGFHFDKPAALALLKKVEKELSKLDEAIHASFRQRPYLIREVHPVLTKHNTLHRKDFRWVEDGDLSQYGPYPFCRIGWREFNPASHRQIVDVLHNAGWKPVDRTATAIENARKGIDKPENLKYSWKINEVNLSTLPSSAPAPARQLARRILVESRRRTLTEWLGLAGDDNRIHGKFYAIGAWTHRMAHQKPNTANIPNSTDTQGKTRLYGAEMRSLWSAPYGRLLVGVDAEGIQLRIFAHYIDDEEFTYALTNGRKEDKTDPHSLNQRILGSACRSRAAAKRFIFALLLGAGLSKLSEILDCETTKTQEALDRLLARYTGFAHLKKTIIPRDAHNGYFVGLDGRKVPILGDTESSRRHLAMSGYLQNGEAVVMKHATLLWYDILNRMNIEFKLVNMVHDEWQTECKEDWNTALLIAYIQADSLRLVGEKLKLKCPLAGSYWNDDLKDYTIGTNWKVTH